MTQPRFKGKVAASGNSGALRMEAGFFKALPRFASGSEVFAERISDEVVIIRAGTSKKGAGAGEEIDPVMHAFLDFLEQDMINHPESIQPVSERDLDEIATLVEGVELD